LFLRPIKRTLLFASEVGLLLFGLVGSTVLGGALRIHFESSAGILPDLVSWSGLAFTIAGLVIFRRRTLPWKIEYDAEGWELFKVECKEHPAHARYRRIVRRSLLWVPSLIAALVVFFFPVVSHILHPRSEYLRHYRVPIPWNITVLSWSVPYAESDWVFAFGSSSGTGLFGVTPFRVWDPSQPTSFMVFQSISPDAGTFEFNHKQTEARRAGAPQVFTRQFRLGDVALSCWQYVPRWSWSQGANTLWEVACETPVDGRQHSFRALLYGRKEDILRFYKIGSSAEFVGESSPK